MTYDRIGTGGSTHGDPLADTQAFLEVESLAELTRLLRKGAVPGIPKFTKFVHGGHSFGSLQSYQLAANYPKLSDGLFLTGFSQVPSGIGEYVLGGAFVQANTLPKWKKYPNGYFAFGTVGAFQTDYFSPVPGTWDPAILEQAAAAPPVTIGEVLTIGLLGAPPNNIVGPVLIVTGSRDLPFCAGNCFAVGSLNVSSIPALSAGSFPLATAFEAAIIPNGAHALNLVIQSGILRENLADVPHRRSFLTSPLMRPSLNF